MYMYMYMYIHDCVYNALGKLFLVVHVHVHVYTCMYMYILYVVHLQFNQFINPIVKFTLLFVHNHIHTRLMLMCVPLNHWVCVGGCVPEYGHR